ncbi:MAG: Lrp/AsnC ligand binding domain-containing protein [Candidatus Nitrosotenuis sp.]
MTQTAYILISCNVGSERDVLSELKKIPEIKSAMVTYGEYDIVAKAEADSEDKMGQLISSRIRQLQKIRSTVTLYVS